MITHGRNIKVFTGNSHSQLAQDIAEILGVPVGNSKVSTFSDGEISVDINETVRGNDVFIVQSTSSPVNNNLMELLIMIDAFKRASAVELQRLFHIMDMLGRIGKLNQEIL